MKLYTVAYIILTFLGIGQIIIGAGFKSLGGVFLKSAALATVGAVIGSILALLLFMPIRGGQYNEGVGLALFFLLIGGSCLGWLAAFSYFFIRLKRRLPEQSKKRTAAVPLRLVIGVLSIAPVCVNGMKTLYWNTPTLLSNSQLIEQILNSREREPKALTVLLSRGQEASADLIAKTEQVISRSHDANEGIRLLEMLGKIGGSANKTAVRGYLAGNYSVAIRARAALVLANNFHDNESIPAIAQLLQHREKKWREFQALLIEALRILDAKDQVPAILSALTFEPAIAHTSIASALQNAGIRALAHLGGEQAWSAILQFYNSPETRLNTLQILRDSDTSIARDIFLIAITDATPQVQTAACESLLRLPSVHARISSSSCPNPNQEGWNMLMQELQITIVALRPDGETYN